MAALGPTFAFPVISKFARQDPRNALVVSKIMHAVETKIVLPGAILMPITGTALTFAGNQDLWRSEWLLVALGPSLGRGGMFLTVLTVAILVLMVWQFGGAFTR